MNIVLLRPRQQVFMEHPHRNSSGQRTPHTYLQVYCSLSLMVFLRKRCYHLSDNISDIFHGLATRSQKLVKRASAGLEEWKQGTRRETERWLAVDESLRSVNMMAKAALGDLQGARDALRLCSSLLRNSSS